MLQVPRVWDPLTIQRENQLHQRCCSHGWGGMAKKVAVPVAASCWLNLARCSGARKPRNVVSGGPALPSLGSTTGKGWGMELKPLGLPHRT